MKHENHKRQHKKDHGSHHAHMLKDFRSRFWISLILTVPVLALSPFVQTALGLEQLLSVPRQSYWLFFFSTLVFFYGGWPFLKGLYKELRSVNPGMMTLIGLATSVSYFYSAASTFLLEGEFFFWELVTLIDVMLLGHWIEMRSVISASRALEELAKLLPDEAHLVSAEGAVKDVPLSELEEGDRVLVKPGEKIPADGIVVSGKSAVNEALLTGEMRPILKTEGEEVIGGSVNGSGSLTLELTGVGESSYLSRISNLVREAQSSKSRAQNLADRAARWLTVVAISAGAVTFLVWLLIVGVGFSFALTRMVSVMVVTCPHALGLAIPLVIAVSTATAAREGILVRKRLGLERMRDVDVVVFDKTGTLTKGEFKVTDTVSFREDFSSTEILALAASVESHSEHPLAQAIVQESDEKYSVSEFKAITGKGVQGKIKDKLVQIVSAGYLKEQGFEIPEQELKDLDFQTTVFVIQSGELIGAIALSDQIRPTAKKAISGFRREKVKTFMITGDRRDVAERVSGELGLDAYFAEVLPEEKLEKIKGLQGENAVVAMVGDGVNDAPALAVADIGIAIGSGTDVAAETADIILVKNNPLDVLKLLYYSRASHAKMIQNLFWATGYNIVAIPLAAGVLFMFGIVLSPPVGALLMALSTVIVAVNARLFSISKNVSQL